MTGRFLMSDLFEIDEPTILLPYAERTALGVGNAFIADDDRFSCLIKIFARFFRFLLADGTFFPEKPAKHNRPSFLKWIDLRLVQ